MIMQCSTDIFFYSSLYVCVTKPDANALLVLFQLTYDRWCIVLHQLMCQI